MSFAGLETKFQRVHTSPVTSIAHVRPGLCLTGSQERSVILYDYHNGEQVGNWTLHGHAITRVAYGHGDKLCASASRDKNVFVWKESAVEQVLKLDDHRLPVMGLDFSPDCKQICTGSRDNSIKLWDLTSGQKIGEEITSRNLVTHLRWSKISDLVIQTSEDKQLRVWDMRSLRVVHTFAKHQYIQTHCDISSDDNHILTCTSGGNGNGCELQLWDLRKQKQIRNYRGHEQTVSSCTFLTPVRSVASQAISQQIASVSLDETIRLWDQETGECQLVERVSGAGALTDIQDLCDASVGVATCNLGIQRYLRGHKFTGDLVIKHVSSF